MPRAVSQPETDRSTQHKTPSPTNFNNPSIYLNAHTHVARHRLSEFLRGAGLKTALVSGPHRAVSVLLHKPEAAVAGGRDDVWLMLGVHPQQVGWTGGGWFDAR